MPRKSVSLDEHQIHEMGVWGVTQPEIARFYGISQSSVSRWLNKEPYKTAYESGVVEGDISLRRKLYEGAMNGGIKALDIALKNRLGFSDRLESKTDLTADVSHTQVTWEASWGSPDDD